MTKDYVLAIYDFRSKQDYIYKTNKIKEIMGASKLIEDAYRDGIRSYNEAASDKDRIDSDTQLPFSLAKFKESQYSACVLYEGGGVLLMMFKNEYMFKKFNNHFSWRLIENVPGLTPICGMGSFDESMNYDENVKCAFNSLNRYKCLAAPVTYADILPITQVDRRTSSPVTYKGNITNNSEPISISAESAAKHESYKKIKDKYAKNLDDLVESKGDESLLALIYVDGNAMGERVQNATKNKNFEEGVNEMRNFSEQIHNAFVKAPIEAIENTVCPLEDGKETLAMRRIIAGGDEITIVCNARKALEVANVYFSTLDRNFSACMGIAIFHSHAPFADIYKIAEQCCESGKAKTRNGNEDKNFIDVFFCHSAITNTIEELRKLQYLGRTKMPYRIGDDFDKFIAMGEKLKKIARTNVKALRDAAFISKVDFELECLRIKSNNANFDLTVDDISVFCDVSSFFDIWFCGKENKEDSDVSN